MKKENGMAYRKLDILGRIVLPIEMRRKLGADLGKELEITLEGDRIIIKKPAASCAVCGSMENLVGVEDAYMCESCVKKASAMFGAVQSDAMASDKKRTRGRPPKSDEK